MVDFSLMNSTRVLLLTSASLFLLLGSSAHGINLAGGGHIGFAVIGDETVLGTETGPEFGVWLNVWPTEFLAISCEWGYIPREDFTFTMDSLLLGEEARNRQYVDVTLQIHFFRRDRFSVFVEAGGGSHWDNRHVINPNGHPGFEPQGKESTKNGVWTVGGGIRTKLIPHLNWINEVKFHNPGSSDSYGVRILTGLTVSWK